MIGLMPEFGYEVIEPEFVTVMAASGSWSSYTWTSVLLGKSRSDKRVYVAISGSASGNVTLNSMKIGGVSAVRVARALDTSYSVFVEIWQADVSAPTGDIQCVWSGSGIGATLAVYAAYGVSSGAVYSLDRSNLTTNGTTITTTVNIKRNTIVLTVFRFASGTATFTLTNATDDTPSLTYGHFGHDFNPSDTTGRVITGTSTESVHPRTMLTVVIER